MYGYIYITVNLINGKKYIGQHKGIFDSNYLGSGKLIRRAIKKYGKDNFIVSILEYAPTKEKLNEQTITNKYQEIDSYLFSYAFKKKVTNK